MSTYSPDLRIELIATGDQAGTWGTTTNKNLGTLIEAAIAGYQTVSVTSASQAFTAIDGLPDEARNALIQLTTTTTAAFAVYAPPVSKQYIIWNNSAYTATIGNYASLGPLTPTGGATVAIASGDKIVVFSDGTNFYAVKSSGITSTLGIANGGTGGTATPTAGAVAYGTGSAYAFTSAGTAGQVLTSNGASAPTWTTVTATTATNLAGGAANRIAYQSGASTTTFITAPTTASTYLGWDGSAFTWSNVAPSGSTFATDISVNSLTVGKGPNNATGATTFGYQASNAATSNNIQQTAIGYRALATNTNTPNPTGLDSEGNTAVGYKALESANSTSTYARNTAVGAAALSGVTTGYANTAVGNGAGQGIGTGTNATAIGVSAGAASTVGSFTAVGSGALSASTTRTAGSTAVGVSALANAKTNLSNSAIYNENNTAVGQNALSNLDADSSGAAGSTNTAIGRSAGSSLVSGSNNSFLGSGAQPSTTTVSNEITLGNSSIATLRCQVTSITSLSDQRDKYDIEDLPVGLDLIKQLRPRRFKWDKRDWYVDEVTREDGSSDMVEVPKDGSRAKTDWNEGFIAQEAKAALQAVGGDWFPLVYESNPEKLEMSSGKLIPVLVKAIQELTARLEALEGK